LEDLLDMEGGATFVSSLGLNMIVKSSLCPLLVCQKIVVKEFARLTKEHQIVYCAQYMRRQSVISLPVQLERGYRAAPSAMEPAPNQLEDFFPFDPYLLQVCARACVCFERQGRGRGSTWTWTRAHTHTHNVVVLSRCHRSWFEPLPSAFVFYLQRSISVIEPLFRAWTGGGIEEVDSSGDSAEEDDDEVQKLGIFNCFNCLIVFI